MYFKLFLSLIYIFISVVSCLDSVSENLTLRPLTNGDWLVLLDLSVKTVDFNKILQNPNDPYFLMDVMPIDVAKLYVKTKVDWFEANLGFGEWKDSVWGDRPDMLITNGLSLMGCWHTLDKKLVKELYSSLCYGLWGLTGSMFTNLLSDELYVHDLTQLYDNDYRNDTLSNSTVLVSSDFEDRVCLDTLFKLRMLFPCLCTNGLVSLLGDERLFVRSSYRGVSLRVERVDEELVFKSRVQFTVSKASLPTSFAGFFPNEKFPKNCMSVSKSSVSLMVPESMKSHNYNTLTYDYFDLQSREELSQKYTKLLSTYSNGYELANTTNELVFEVSELESKFLKVLKRVQSSLLVKVSNLSKETKNLCVHQPLPYWLKPLLHSVNLVVESLDDAKVLYKCKSAVCFSRNSRFTRNYNLFLYYTSFVLPNEVQNVLYKLFDFFVPLPKLPKSKNDPLMIFDHGKQWNTFGTFVSLPPNSVMYLSVELLKDNITYEDIHLSAHRGQLIPSALLLDTDKLKASSGSDQSQSFKYLSSYDYPNFYHFMTSFFSHIVLPDNTMVFNVMALVGVVNALIFGFVFNTFTRDWERKFEIN